MRADARQYDASITDPWWRLGRRNQPRPFACSVRDGQAQFDNSTVGPHDGALVDAQFHGEVTRGGQAIARIELPALQPATYLGDDSLLARLVHAWAAQLAHVCPLSR